VPGYPSLPDCPSNPKTINIGIQYQTWWSLNVLSRQSRLAGWTTVTRVSRRSRITRISRISVVAAISLRRIPRHAIKTRWTR
jgi:hypothetical protein